MYTCTSDVRKQPGILYQLLRDPRAENLLTLGTYAYVGAHYNRFLSLSLSLTLRFHGIPGTRTTETINPRKFSFGGFFFYYYSVPLTPNAANVQNVSVQVVSGRDGFGDFSGS